MFWLPKILKVTVNFLSGKALLGAFIYEKAFSEYDETWLCGCVLGAGWVTTGRCTRRRLEAESGVRRTGPPRGMGQSQASGHGLASAISA